MPISPSSRSPFRRLVIAAALAIGGGLLWAFPLVRIRRLSAVVATAAFDPRAFAERFWTDDLTPALAAARDAGEVMAAVRHDASDACRSLGRSVGLSRTCLYLVRGAGTIAAVEPAGCRVALDGDAGEVVLATGLVFGTAVRDVTGTVDPASRTDSRELAAAATEINRLVQDRAIAPLIADATVGGRVEFVACGQVQGKLAANTPWRLVPLRIGCGAPAEARGEARAHPLARARGSQADAVPPPRGPERQRGNGAGRQRVIVSDDRSRSPRSRSGLDGEHGPPSTSPERQRGDQR